MLISEGIVRDLIESVERQAVRLIVVSLAFFFLYRLALIGEVHLGDGERSHAVRFEEQAEVDLIRRQCFVIFGAIAVGRAVHASTIVFDQNKVLAFSDIRGTLKHHVFEQMGEAGPAGPLIS